ncbi:hypothetical protein AACH06_24935 [Ideonella sp. DXS29W]|uniref:Cytochrome c domain-containing protein n=1 Tax=Ideonella lacteola TaxID=2984193 RepID=A0ABU9BXD9_9BURK
MSKRLNRQRLVAGLLILLSAAVNAGTCPRSVGKLTVPLDDYDPPPKPGEPAMTIKGLDKFIKENDIRDVAAFLSKLPANYQKRYALMEKTRGAGKASLENPRIVFFGADARLLMNVGSDPSDPLYEQVDVAYMNKKSGGWEFAKFDFQRSGSKLVKNPVECVQCHGTPMRPFWGKYLNWPGAFSDNPSPGDQAESMTEAQARRLNELKGGKGNPARFQWLMWAPSYTAGYSQMLPDHDYGYALTISNNSLGYTAAESIFLRLKKKYPDRYAALREELLILSYYDRRTSWVTEADRKKIAASIASYGGSGSDYRAIFKVLGIKDIDFELSIDRLAFEPQDQTWTAASGDLLGLVLMLVLNDVAGNDAGAKTVLQQAPIGTGVYGIWGCPDLGTSVMDSLTYRITQGWGAKGEARQVEEAAFYDVDVSRVYQPIFEQPGKPLFDYLKTKI